MLTVRNAVFLNVLMLAMPVALSRPASAQQPTRPEAKMAHMHAAQVFEIPASMRAEHEEIHAALERATQASGRGAKQPARSRKCCTRISFGRITKACERFRSGATVFDMKRGSPHSCNSMGGRVSSEMLNISRPLVRSIGRRHFNRGGCWTIRTARQSGCPGSCASEGSFRCSAR